MMQDSDLMTPQVLRKLNELVKAGAALMVADRPKQSPSLTNFSAADQEVKQLADAIWNKSDASFIGNFLSVGKGKVVFGPYQKIFF